MNTSVDDLKRIMSSKTDEELYDILYGHPDDYTADARAVAKNEFTSRNLAPQSIENFNITVEKQKQIEEAPLELPLKIIAFFFSTMLLGIPVLLAHRHYLENGARRKAREWGRWGLLGLLFYFVIGVFRFMVLILSK